jgi:hypothetical protein
LTRAILSSSTRSKLSCPYAIPRGSHFLTICFLRLLILFCCPRTGRFIEQ